MNDERLVQPSASIKIGVFWTITSWMVVPYFRN